MDPTSSVLIRVTKKIMLLSALSPFHEILLLSHLTIIVLKVNYHLILELVQLDHCLGLCRKSRYCICYRSPDSVKNRLYNPAVHTVAG